MITTTRVVEDVVVLLKERGIDDITIGEGMVTMSPGDTGNTGPCLRNPGLWGIEAQVRGEVPECLRAPLQAGGPRRRISTALQRGCARRAISSSICPVMKSHNQTVVSLGIKNLKGLIDIPSRKRCHSMRPGRDLHAWVARLADQIAAHVDPDRRHLHATNAGRASTAGCTAAMSWWPRPTCCRPTWSGRGSSGMPLTKCPISFMRPATAAGRRIFPMSRCRGENRSVGPLPRI
ncbi:MAG: DUF362 domain-containing protein [Desulfosudis oleivorans]|nr:DUF362 domain-containing protein [Desulfosudis oleivorans]